MITVSIREVEGVRFLSDVRILEPDDKVNGVGVHRISKEFCEVNPDKELSRAIKLLGLRRVDYDLRYHAYLYAQYPVAVWQYKLLKLLLSVYWKTVWLLYDNARFFKEIPDGERFSWRYFTPYTWLKKWRWVK